MQCTLQGKKTDNLSSEKRDFSIRPDDIPARLQEAKDKVDALFPSPLQRLHDLFDQGNDWLQRKAKLDLGFNYTVLYQHASQAQSSNDAAAGDLDFFGRWHLFDFDGRWPAALSFSTEWRHKFTTVSPSELGDNIGSLWGTTVGFNTQDYAMVELYWEQGSYDDGLTMRAGKVDPALIYDGGRYVSQNYAFLSPAFSDTPAMPLPAPGLGTAAAVYPFEDFYVLGGVHDANAKKTQSGINTIDRGEFFVALEFGVFRRFRRTNEHLLAVCVHQEPVPDPAPAPPW